MEDKKVFLGRIGEALRSELVKKVYCVILSFFGSMLCSRGLVFGSYAPFGVAFAAAVPKEYMWIAVAGCSFGYILPSPAYISVRYIAAALAVAAIRWSLSELKRITDHPIFVPVVIFLPLMATGMAMVLINSSLSSTAAMYVAEAFMGAGCGYFLRRAVLLASSGRERSDFDMTDLASIMISVGIALLSFSSLSIAGVSLGHILMAVMVLYAAHIGGISAGAVAGVTAGVVQGLSTAGLSYLSGAYGLGGLMAGIFAPLGKIFTALAFVISHGVASLQIDNSYNIITGSIEVCAATLIFMFLPKSRSLSDMFSHRKENLSGEVLRKNIVSRLNRAASALTGVSEAVDRISKTMTGVPDIHSVYNTAAEEVCSGCGLKLLCWKKNHDAVMESFSHMESIFREKGAVTREELTGYLADKCRRPGLLCESVSRNYRDFTSAAEMQLKYLELRDTAREQFLTSAGLLRDISSEFAGFQHIDEEAGDRIEGIFRKYDIYPAEVCCSVDKYGRMTVEAELENAGGVKLNRSKFTREVAAACGRSFSPPCVTKNGSSCHIRMCQKPLLNVEFETAQHSAGNSNFCGDSVTGFFDGQGRFIAMISDGMGTGGRAAVDGVLTSSVAEILLKSGIGFESSLRLINSALMAKSDDESLSTLDITVVDLFTGEAEFKKAGASGTFVRRGRKVSYTEKSSLPVGIMPEVRFADSFARLKAGDMVVMVSDGAVSCGTDWIKELMEEFDADDISSLAASIVNEACKQRNDGHEDDISAAVLRIR